MIQVEESAGTAPRLALFAYGFRPFFLAAGLQALLGVAAIAAVAVYGAWPDGAMTAAAWHFHEMMFGFVAAAIAGFLLTAVPNWTGERGHAGRPLAALAGLWLAGRIALAPGLGLTPALVAAIDLAFLPALAVVVGRSLIRARLARNYPVLGVLIVLSLANGAFHAESLGLWPEGIGFAKRLSLDVMLILVALIGGRIVPAFTVNGLRRHGLQLALKPFPGIEIASPATLVLLLVVDLAWPESTAVGWAAGAAAIVQALRLSRWHGHRSLKDPLIWVLHLGYAWLVLGLALKAAWFAFGASVGQHWLHALTAGAFATMILAVMTRATLGHTGRQLIAPPLAVVAYVLTSLAAAIRVFGPTVAGGDMASIAGLAGAIWSGAMLAYLVAYAPILVRRRADGKPG
jgi:uncharacterized protein involved in response to NO